MSLNCNKSLSKNKNTLYRVVNSDFRMGGDRSPPIGGGLKGGDKGPMGGEWRVIRDIFWALRYKGLKGVKMINVSYILTPNCIYLNTVVIWICFISLQR